MEQTPGSGEQQAEFRNFFKEFLNYDIDTCISQIVLYSKAIVAAFQKYQCQY